MSLFVLRVSIIALFLHCGASAQSPESGAKRQDGLSLIVETAKGDRLADLELRIRALEQVRHRSESVSPVLGTLTFLFGAFCALWAQNTGRNSWLWFFFGVFGSVITVIVLLTKNSNEHFSRQQWKRYTGRAPDEPL